MNVLEYLEREAANQGRSSREWAQVAGAREQAAFRSGCEATARQAANWVRRQGTRMEAAAGGREAGHYFDSVRRDEVLIGIWTGGHDWMDSGIKLMTRGRGTHAAFIRGSGNIIENFYPRVRERGWRAGERALVEEYRIAGGTPDDWAALENWFDAQLKTPPPYSVLDLLRYAVNLPPRPGAACFCSMWVLRGLRLNLAPSKLPLARLEWPDYASPRDLRLSPKLVKLKKQKWEGRK